MEKPGSWSRCSRNDGKGELEHKAQQESGLGRRPRHRFVLVAEALSKEIPFYCLVCSVWAQGQGSEGFPWAPPGAEPCGAGAEQSCGGHRSESGHPEPTQTRCL